MNGQQMLNAVRRLLQPRLFTNYPQMLPKLGPYLPDREAPAAKPGQKPPDKWRVYCGEGRFDEQKGNALFRQRTGIGLNFQIEGREAGADSTIQSFEICVVWPDGWRLMFHRDPRRACWPEHPEHHMQFQAPRPPQAEPPPFHSWRPPLAETAPEKLLEYILAHTG